MSEETLTGKPEEQPAAPTGRALEFDAAAAGPNEAVQLVMKVEQAGLTIAGMVFDEAATPQTIYVGKHQFGGPSDPGGWEKCKGQALPVGSFLIAVVRNDTPVSRAIKGVVFVTGDKDAVAKIPESQFSPAKAPVYDASQAMTPTNIGTAPTQPAPRSVVPGSNEVAVLLQRADALRLYDIVSGKHGTQPLQAHELPALQRAFGNALKQ